MIAYYIHWSYPTTADDSLYYGGDDDDRLFHHKENAEKIAKESVKHWDEKKIRLGELSIKYWTHKTTPEEEKEYYEMIGYGDTPNGYTICERDIKFEDEE